jgi:hypothetical protein
MTTAAPSQLTGLKWGQLLQLAKSKGVDVARGGGRRGTKSRAEIEEILVPMLDEAVVETVTEDTSATVKVDFKNETDEEKRARLLAELSELTPTAVEMGPNYAGMAQNELKTRCVANGLIVRATGPDQDIRSMMIAALQQADLASGKSPYRPPEVEVVEVPRKAIPMDCRVMKWSGGQQQPGGPTRDCHIITDKEGVVIARVMGQGRDKNGRMVRLDMDYNAERMIAGLNG